MPEPKDIPYLLNLLNDGSGFVQEAVLRELASFGPYLEYELLRMENPPDPIEVDYINRVVQEYRRNLVRQQQLRSFKDKTTF